MALVTVAQAKEHLYMPGMPDGDPMDPDLALKLSAAEIAVVDYCGTAPHWRPIVDAWDAATVPPPVVAAILIVFGELMRARGDDLGDTGPAREPGDDFPAAVIGLLRRYRDPVLA